MTTDNFWGMYPVLDAVEAERWAQLRKWGAQKHADGTGREDYEEQADLLKSHNDHQAQHGRDNSWDTILLEEVFEALAETDRAKLRAELVQVAAVAVAWIEDIDGRANDGRS